ncbi:hypothetical protein H1Q59_04260 [Holosporaceae bacterium 'Namur']|nr:hypothetical protein [Holosporaceae bacterium 'Namur']
MHKPKVVAIVLLLLTGCSCKSSHMEEMKVVEITDEYKDCSDLLYSIKEAEHLVNYANKRYKFPQVFMSSPVCIPVVQIDSLKNKLILQDRLDYLNSLFEAKGCNSLTKNKEEKNNDTDSSSKVIYTNLAPTQ